MEAASQARELKKEQHHENIRALVFDSTSQTQQKKIHENRKGEQESRQIQYLPVSRRATTIIKPIRPRVIIKITNVIAA